MKLWIIGKRGMLSQAMQRVCKEKGIEAIATTRREADITDPQSLNAQFESEPCTHVINCSGYTAVDRAEQEEEKARALNVDGVINLAMLAKEKGVKLIHFSTDYVFDGNGTEPYTEDARTGPLSVYGKTKREGEEKLLEVYPEACIIRTSWLFGLEGNHFVQTMVKLMSQHESLRVVSDQKGRPTFCDDLAQAALKLLDERGIFHFANRGEATWLEFAEEILQNLREKKAAVRCASIHPILSDEYGTIAKRPAFSTLSTEKYEAVTKQKPRMWRECLKDYFERIPC